jgi:hypothetical protein
VSNVTRRRIVGEWKERTSATHGTAQWGLSGSALLQGALHAVSCRANGIETHVGPTSQIINLQKIS